MFRPQPKIYVQNGNEAANEQRRAGEQDHRQRELECHKEIFYPATFACVRRTPPGRVEELPWHLARGFPSRSESEEYSGQQTHGNRKQESPRIESDFA